MRSGTNECTFSFKLMLINKFDLLLMNILAVTVLCDLWLACDYASNALENWKLKFDFELWLEIQIWSDVRAEHIPWTQMLCIK